MPFWGMMLLWAALFVVGELLRPKPKMPNARPDSIEPPSIEQGEVIPVVFGTCKVSPRLTWFGDEDVKEVTEKVKTGLFSSDEVIVAYKYHAGMMLAVCWGLVDELIDIWFGDYAISRHEDYKSTFPLIGTVFTFDSINPDLPISSGVSSFQTFTINAPTIFGGKRRNGGLGGKLTFYFGAPDQPADFYLGTHWGGENLSQYRWLSYAVVKGMWLGNSPQIPPITFVVRRCPNPLGIADFNINGDANPANIIYEALTDTLWGQGINPDNIDMDSFVAAGNTLASEGLGISIVVNEQTTGVEMIRMVMDHIDGTLRQNPLDGKISIKLIRPDYDINALPIFTKSNSFNLKYSRSSWQDTVNEVRLTYTDRSKDFTAGVAQDQNLASIQAMGETVTTKMEMRGLSNAQNAFNRVRQLLRVSSIPLDKATFKVNRLAFALAKGDPFVLHYPEKGLFTVVMRVLKIDYGTLTEGTISIDAVQDVWDVLDNPVPGDASLPDMYCGSFISDLFDDHDIPGIKTGVGAALIEAPYGIVLQQDHAVALAAVYQNYTDWIGWFFRRHVNGSLWTEVSDGLSPFQFTPGGWLQDTYVAETDSDDESGFVVRDNADTLSSMAATTLGSSGGDLAARTAGETLTLIGSEIVAWREIEDLGNGTYRLKGILRGLFDTVPEDHLPGTMVLVIGQYWAHVSQGYELQSGDVVYGAFARTTALTTEQFHGQTVLPIKGRASAPLPPGNVRLNGADYASWPSTVIGDATLSWSHRNAVEQGAALVSQSDATDYTLDGELKVEAIVNGTVKRTWNNVVGNSIIWEAADRAADNPTSARTWFRITPVGPEYMGVVRETPTFK